MDGSLISQNPLITPTFGYMSYKMVNLTLKESYGPFPDYFLHLLFTLPLHSHYDAAKMSDLLH